MSEIMSCVSGFLDRCKEGVIALLLKRQKMILLLKSGITVQTDRHQKEHGIKKCKDYKEYKTDDNISL